MALRGGCVVGADGANLHGCRASEGYPWWRGLTHRKQKGARYENPMHLMELSRKPEFSHLRHPYLEDIIILPIEEHLAEAADEE